VEENRLGKREKSTLTHIDMDMAKPMNMYKNIRMRWLDGCCRCRYRWKMENAYLCDTHTHTHMKLFLRLQQGHHQQEQQQQRLLLCSVNSCRD